MIKSWYELKIGVLCVNSKHMLIILEPYVKSEQNWKSSACVKVIMGMKVGALVLKYIWVENCFLFLKNGVAELLKIWLKFYLHV